MSFDLYLCARGEPILDGGYLKRHMSSVPYMAEVDNGTSETIQFQYDNPATGVHCLFEVCSREDAGSENEAGLPPGLTSWMFVAINFLRPHFFALEAMPVIAGIAKSLGLLVYDPQEDQTYLPETSPDVLIQTWITHNERATRAVARGDDPIRKPFLSRERSLYWWRYMKVREAYQQSLSDDVFVPSILLMADSDNRIQLTVIWSAEVQRRLLALRRNALPQIFPAFDYLLLAWGKDGERFEKGFVSANDSERLLAEVLEPIEGPVDGLRILRPSRQADGSDVFDRLPRFSTAAFKQIAPDGFVDVWVE